LTGKPVTLDAALALLYLAVFGMLLGVIFAKTQSLLPPLVVHAMNNLLL
jgi:membrane protease YdiL (CAAX protease family)